jgi:hypothetical protein
MKKQNCVAWNIKIGTDLKHGFEATLLRLCRAPSCNFLVTISKADILVKTVTWEELLS